LVVRDRSELPSDCDGYGDGQHKLPPSPRTKCAPRQGNEVDWITRHEFWPWFVVRTTMGTLRRRPRSYNPPRRTNRHVIRYRKGTTAKSGLLLSDGNLAATPRIGRVSASRRVCQED
jgi:hypothetical protein